MLIKIKTAEYIGSFVKLEQLPENIYPEIAIVGRSNVGKSSLINKCLNRKKLAKSSSTPGKTRTINYYLINQSWYIVDLPGYGYAKVSKAEKNTWGKMIENFLKERSSLRGVVQIIDIRHPPSNQDLAMKDWLKYHEIPQLIVVNKADKVSKGARLKQLKLIKTALALPSEFNMIVFSAENGEGVTELHNALAEILEL